MCNSLHAVPIVTFKPDPELPARDSLMSVYHAQKDFFASHKRWAASLAELNLDGSAATINLTDSGYEATLSANLPDGKTIVLHTRQDSRLWANNEGDNSIPIKALEAALEKGELWGEALAKCDFAQVSLSKDDAAKARALLWQAHSARIAKERKAEIDAGVLKLDRLEMPLFMKSFGTQPETGSSLWISRHGGGGAPKDVNDGQWQNQKRLYKLEEGLYVAPRAPTNTWNLWHEKHIDTFFTRLIEDLIVLKQVDPNRVYIMGYSAGGDGVYQLAPRMADRLAAASMMAGHPNDASPLGLRNIGFAIQAGGLDAAYNRNKIARQWIDKLDQLQRDDPKGYVHFGKIFETKAHWMDGEDAKVLPWMAALKRNPIPDRVVWKQSTVLHDRYYWLAVPKGETAVAGAEVIAERNGQTIEIKSASKVASLLIRLDDRMLDLDQPVKIISGGKTLFEGKLFRTIATQIRTLENRGDFKLIFDAEVEVRLPIGNVN